MDPEKLHSFGLQPDGRHQGDPPAEPDRRRRARPACRRRPSTQDFQYTIDIQSRLDDPAEFANIIVKAQTAQGGRLVRVKDIGRIELGSQTYSQQTYRQRQAGRRHRHLPDARRQLAAGRQGSRGEDGRARRAAFPKDLRYDIPYDTTIFVKASIDEVYHDALRGRLSRPRRHPLLPAEFPRDAGAGDDRAGHHHRRLRRHGGARLHGQPVDPVRHRARHRHRRRRRHRHRRGRVAPTSSAACRATTPRSRRCRS